MQEIAMSYLGLFQEMVVFLAVMFLFIFALSKIKPLANVMLVNKHHILSRIFYIAVFGSAVILTSANSIKFGDGILVNFRDAITICSAIIGGPSVGIVVGLIGGVFRFALGGWPAGADAVAVILAGFVAAYIVNSKNESIENITCKSALWWALGALVYEAVHILVFIPVLAPLSSPAITSSISFVKALPSLAPMMALNGVVTAVLLGLFHSIIVTAGKKD